MRVKWKLQFWAEVDENESPLGDRIFGYCSGHVTQEAYYEALARGGLTDLLESYRKELFRKLEGYQDSKQ